MQWLVLIRQNLTAYDTIFRGRHTQRTVSEHLFPSEPEALDFYLKNRNALRVGGDPGMYVTYPVKAEGHVCHTHTCDYCGERFSLERNSSGEEDLGFTDLDGDFCSRECFRNNYQDRHRQMEPGDSPDWEDDYE